MSDQTNNVRQTTPRVPAEVVLVDAFFHSVSLGRDMKYRVISPPLGQGKKYPVVYLLHGGGESYQTWSNYSDVATFASRGLILVMPQGDNSYYVNGWSHKQDRYEDYIAKDLISEIERRFPAESGRSHRAILGDSMGGYGALLLALHHPELFGFVGTLSAAIDVPSRSFAYRRSLQWFSHRAIFGPWNSQSRRDSDPLLLVKTTDAAKSPFFYMTCGDQEGLLAANRRFANDLKQRTFAHDFRVTRAGVHSWSQWNPLLPPLFQSLLDHLKKI